MLALCEQNSPGTKLSAATVRRAVKDLRKAKLIETEQRYRYNGENSSLLYKLKKI